MNPELEEVVEYLRALKEEQDVSKKFKEKTEHVITILTSGAQLSVEKALLELEELNSLNLSPYHRTQVWDAISMLESIKK